MRPLALLAVSVLHAALLAVLWAVWQHSSAPVARRELAVRLLPGAAATPAPSPSRRAAPPVLSLPAFATIAPPGIDVQADNPAAPPAAGPAPSAAPARVAWVPPPAPRTEAAAAEPTLQSARRAACAAAPHPPLLRERGIEGVVRLRVWVDELGRAGQVLLAASSGWRLFDDAAVAQARRCPFHPALRGNEPVGSWVEFPVRFVLESSNG